MQNNGERVLVLASRANWAAGPGYKDSESSYAGSFGYARPMKGHEWQPTTNAELVKEVASTPAEMLLPDRLEQWHRH